MLLELSTMLVLLERVIWMCIAMRGECRVNGGIKFLGSPCADSSVEVSGEAFEVEEAAHGARVDCKECRSVFGCGLECVLHDAVS